MAESDFNSIFFSPADFSTEHRRLQGLFQGRPGEGRLAAHVGAEEAVLDSLSVAPDAVAHNSQHRTRMELKTFLLEIGLKSSEDSGGYWNVEAVST